MDCFDLTLSSLAMTDLGSPLFVDCRAVFFTKTARNDGIHAFSQFGNIFAEGFEKFLQGVKDEKSVSLFYPRCFHS